MTIIQIHIRAGRHELVSQEELCASAKIIFDAACISCEPAFNNCVLISCFSFSFKSLSGTALSTVFAINFAIGPIAPSSCNTELCNPVVN